MDFLDKIKLHAKMVNEFKEHVATEQAAKMALIVPFLQMLGYNPNDPRVVIPEYCADFGEKKGCKVDYAIKRGDEIVIIVEAKKIGDPLDGPKESQLQQYFQSILPVKIAILTDGVVYKFYTDLENTNVMDKKPFMIFDFADIEEPLVIELKKLCNDCFDVDTALCAAQELKYLGQLKKLVASEIERPSDELTKHFARQVYEGNLIISVVDAFRERVRVSFEDIVATMINNHLQSAMKPSGHLASPTTEPEDVGSCDCDTESHIVTTKEEQDGFDIVKAIMSKVVNPDRVVMRDVRSYCGVLFDNKNTKPICRMYFNSRTVKYLETFDADKKGTKHLIESIIDIYKFENELRAVVNFYDN